MVCGARRRHFPPGCSFPAAARHCGVAGCPSAAAGGWGAGVSGEGRLWRAAANVKQQPEQALDTKVSAPDALCALQAGVIVVCCGGGGIPVAVDASSRRRRGVEAVVDKDEGECVGGWLCVWGYRVGGSVQPCMRACGRKLGLRGVSWIPVPTPLAPPALAGHPPPCLLCSLGPAGHQAQGRLAADAHRSV